MSKIKLISLFSGIGAFEKALNNVGIDYELVNYCEIDKNASKSYSAIHNEPEAKNMWDISKINIENLPTNVDLITHGSPCQNFSIIGTQDGGDKGSGTQSSLLWYSVEIIKHCKPSYVIWENVKNVLSKTHKHNFDEYLNTLKNLGYTNYYQILNSMDFGIPQNRERIFVVSCLGKNDFDFGKLQKTEMKNINEFLETNVSSLYEVKQKSMLSAINGFKLNKKFKGRLKVIDKFVYTISTKQVRVPNSGIIDLHNGKYRYLTERECFRLMGFDDSDVDILEKIHPKRKNCMSSILYRQAGNSIVVNVLEEIFKSLLMGNGNVKGDYLWD